MQEGTERPSDSNDSKEPPKTMSRGKFLKIGAGLVLGAAVGKAATEAPHAINQALGRPEAWTDDDAHAWLEKLEQDLREAQTVNEKDAVMSRLLAVESAFPEFERYDAVQQKYTDLKQRWIDRFFGTSTTYMRYDDVYKAYEQRIHRAILLAGPQRLAKFLKLSTLVVNPKEQEDAISYCIWRSYFLVEECETMSQPELAKQLMAEIHNQLPNLLQETQRRITTRLGNNDELAIYEETARMFQKYHIK